MYPTAISSPPSATATNSVGQKIYRVLTRKIWLPRTTYEALPYLYIFLGAYAIAAALFLRHWSWVVPYLVLLGVICLHMGATIVTLRVKRRNTLRRQRQNLPE